MEYIINDYLNFLNNMSLDKQIKYLQSEINDYKRFLKMYEDEHDLENVNHCKNEIVKLRKLINDIKNGDQLQVSIDNVKTNIK